VAFEDLQIPGEEKDASILQLRQEAETTHADLEKEKKQVKGGLPPIPRLSDFTGIFSLLISLPLQVCGELLGCRRCRWNRSRQPTTPCSRI
jgi:hypothetical protein